MGLDVPWWWLGRRGNVSTHSSTGTKLEKKITCLCSLTCLNQMENLFINMLVFFGVFLSLVCICLFWWAREPKKLQTCKLMRMCFYTTAAIKKTYYKSCQTFPLPWGSASPGLFVYHAVCHIDKNNTCFTPINHTRRLWAPVKDIELKLTELKRTNPHGLRSKERTTWT